MTTRFTYRQQYDDEADAIERAITDIVNDEPSMTEQHHAADADLNTIVARFGIGDGAIPPAAMDPRYFGDFTDAVDLKTSLDRVREAEERFAALPVEIRRRFGNDPVALWDFVNNPANDEEAIKLGLLAKIEPEPVPAPTPPSP